MRYLSAAGMLLVAALLFVQPFRADTFNTYEITFTLPTTLTPSSVTWNGIVNFQNLSGTFNGAAYQFRTVQIGSAGVSNYTHYWGFGSRTRSIALLVRDCSPGIPTEPSR